MQIACSSFANTGLDPIQILDILAIWLETGGSYIADTF